ncbi:23S rRNA (uracil(1939)-C(5))-methyltransferase RlmD [Clostridiaceae bacterium NSJ-31]|uniref:23S rRNA (Uracil(1939)-C(5))-methyltransferase RlmD n=4 Tax=Ligaoa zhengdingensis TaxID=2763658 RepID=A0A926DUZ8_9FIRM|nr:23S rRNA (uracil(1939)-C(5))-methyltransferase RlmD [Ligaoa zhengdingensis]MBC8545828.1 23S rRNA (uracil(1939)-C(5))-methyltransferase RlmD [Ligaoa zhengdingensis]
MYAKNDLVELSIIDITDEGNGVGKIDGFAVFVPGTAVDDRLRVKLVKIQKNFAYGIVEEILSPSPDRIPVDCRVYRQCGGCSLRHISYQAELQIKQNWVEQHLKRIGGIDAPVLPIIGSPRQDGYRNKAQYPVRMEDGELRLGMFGKRSHRVIPCTDCRLQPSEFESILKTIRDFCLEWKISIYNEEKYSGLLRHVYLRSAQATGEIMVCLVINGVSLPHSGELVDRLRTVCPSVASIVLNRNREKTNVILGQHCQTLWGKDTIADILCGVRVNLSPLSFYQVNREGAEQLYRVAEEFAGLTGRELLLDLYCGAGTIGLSMAHRVRELIGVEIIPQAVENARRNAQENGITNARFLCDDAKGAAASLQREGLTPDVVVLDPPRKGCVPEVLEAVSGMNPDRIVMVSCNSATLARDLAALRTLGYHTVKAQPVDMFPRTTHVECVALMTR